MMPNEEGTGSSRGYRWSDGRQISDIRESQAMIRTRLEYIAADITDLRRHADLSRDLNDRIKLLEQRMSLIMWVGGIAGGVIIAALVAGFLKAVTPYLDTRGPLGAAISAIEDMAASAKAAESE